MPYTSNKKPSGLDPASSVAGTDVLVIEKSGSVQRATADQMTDYAFSAKGVTAAGSGSEVAVVRDGTTLKDIALSNIVPSGSITNAKVSSNTADRIDGNKITPNFGSQNISTTGGTSTGTLATTSNATVGGTLTVTGLLTASGGINATINGTSAQANQLATARNIAATGDVAWNVNFDGSTNVTNAATIQSNVVNDAKFRQSGACSVVGRSTNTPGNVADIAAASDSTVLRRASGALGFGQVETNAITDAAVTTPKIADASSTTTGVTNSKLRHSSGLSVLGRSADTAGAPADIAGANGQVLRVSGTSLGFGQVATAGLATGAVTPNELATGAVTGAAGGGKLAASAITSQTQKTSIAAADQFLIHSDTDSALRRVAFSVLRPTGSVLQIVTGVQTISSSITAVSATPADTGITPLTLTRTTTTSKILIDLTGGHGVSGAAAWWTYFFVSENGGAYSNVAGTNVAVEGTLLTGGGGRDPHTARYVYTPASGVTTIAAKVYYKNQSSAALWHSVEATFYQGQPFVFTMTEIA